MRRCNLICLVTSVELHYSQHYFIYVVAHIPVGDRIEGERIQLWNYLYESIIRGASERSNQTKCVPFTHTNKQLRLYKKSRHKKFENNMRSSK